eukprot:5286417-Pyramimonas_sp.AAC.1
MNSPRPTAISQVCGGAEGGQPDAAHAAAAPPRQRCAGRVLRATAVAGGAVPAPGLGAVPLRRANRRTRALRGVLLRLEVRSSLNHKLNHKHVNTPRCTNTTP